MIDNKPDAIVIYIGRNVTFNHDNHGYIAYSIVNIGLNFKKHSVNDVLIYYIFVIKNPNLTVIVRQANEILGKKMVIMLFVMMLLHPIIYGKIALICVAWVHIF